MAEPFDHPKLGRLMASRMALAGLPLEVRARELEGVARVWSDPGFPPRSEVKRASRFSEPVFDLGVSRLFGAITEAALLGWWQRSAPPEGGEPPRLSLVLAADNIPGVALFPVVVSLLAGIPVVARSGDPLLVPFTESLAHLSPVLASSIGVMDGGRWNLDSPPEVLAAAERILIFGTDETIEIFERLCPGRVRGYGSSLSVAFIGSKRRNDSAAASALALDVALWDQKGCLSPQAVYVEGGFEDAAAFARLVAAALPAISAEYPPGRLDPAEAARLRLLRADLEARGVAGGPEQTWTSGAGLEWTVIADPDPGFRAGENRTVWVLPVADLDALKPLLKSYRSRLQAAGLAVTPEARREAEAAFRALGFGYVTELGRMQDPPIDWPNKGRDMLKDLLCPGGPAS